MVYNEYNNTNETARFYLTKVIQILQNMIDSMEAFKPEPPQPQELDEVMTPKQAAEYLKISEATLRKMVKQGSIPHFHFKGCLRLRRSRLNAWMEEEERKGA